MFQIWKFSFFWDSDGLSQVLTILTAVEFLYQLAQFGDIEEFVDFQRVVGLDAFVDVLAFQVVEAITMRGVVISEAIG